MLTTPKNIDNLAEWKSWVITMQILNKGSCHIPQPTDSNFKDWVSSFQLTNKNLKLPITNTDNFKDYDSLLKQMGYS